MKISVIDAYIPDIKIIKPKCFLDSRGSFFESFNKLEFNENIGQSISFVQDNQCFSKQNILRGLHYQIKNAQAKLIRVIDGEIFDVAVDLRKSSKHFGLWYGITLTSENLLQLYIPEGFAHGYYVKSENAIVSYKTTDYWFPEHDRSIIWNDIDLGIAWGNKIDPILSEKDK